MAIRLAVFDMAGTTVVDENYVAIAFQKAFSNYGIDITAGDINPLMGYHKPLAIQMMLEKMGIDPDAEFIEEIHTDFEAAMMDFYEYGADVRAIAGSEETFLLLKEKGIRIALNTGFSKNIAQTIVNRFQWMEKGLVDDFIASNEVEKGRPSPLMIRELMKRTGVEDPKEVVKIGDTTVDVEEGNNAGCLYVIAVTTGACKEEDLRKMNPTHIVKHLSEIPAILQ